LTHFFNFSSVFEKSGEGDPMAGMATESQGWFAYSVLLVVAFSVTMLPLVLQMIVRLIGSKKSVARAAPRASLGEASSISRLQSLNTRYFTASQIGALIALPLMLLVPLIGPESGASWHSAILMLVLCATGGCSLVYANRKGDLRWIDTMEHSHESEDLRRGKDG
jgi:NADH:ubiquinone oxidoreductase subunit 3 (subunit A)